MMNCPYESRETVACGTFEKSPAEIPTEKALRHNSFRHLWGLWDCGTPPHRHLTYVKRKNLVRQQKSFLPRIGKTREKSHNPTETSKAMQHKGFSA